jgi:hypothetical protein
MKPRFVILLAALAAIVPVAAAAPAPASAYLHVYSACGSQGVWGQAGYAAEVTRGDAFARLGMNWNTYGGSIRVGGYTRYSDSNITCWNVQHHNRTYRFFSYRVNVVGSSSSMRAAWTRNYCT